MAIADVCLELPGVTGEHPDDNFIICQTFSWGETNSGSALSGGGAGSGQAIPGDLVITKILDKSSNMLMQRCANGYHFASATLHVYKTGGDRLEYLKFELGAGGTDGVVVISSYTISGAGSDTVLPTETVTLNFSSMKMTYNQQNATGQGAGDAELGFDFKNPKNKI